LVAPFGRLVHRHGGRCLPVRWRFGARCAGTEAGVYPFGGQSSLSSLTAAIDE
jgi:hypothetical protein